MRLLLALLCWTLIAQAQDYPAKPIRLIVATAPGGLMDGPARLMADYVEKTYGQRVVVENLSGGAARPPERRRRMHGPAAASPRRIAAANWGLSRTRRRTSPTNRPPT